MYGGKGTMIGGSAGAGGLAYTGSPVLAMVVTGLALLVTGLLFLRASTMRRAAGRHHRA